jgi:DNA gyrase subunit A
MTGIRLDGGASVLWFGVVAPGPASVVTVAGTTGTLPGTGGGTVKVTPYEEYPAKGRGTGGVRCHRLLRGEDGLVLAWAGPAPARGAAASGVPIDLPDPTGRRDGSGVPLRQPLAGIGGPAGTA